MTSQKLRVAQLFVVGVGASAGGLRALEEFLENIPINNGAAFVVIQDLSPDFKSLIKELLSRRTQMAIYWVTEAMMLEANSIYLIPPGKNWVLENNKLHLLEQEEGNRYGLNIPIDIFLESEDTKPQPTNSERFEADTKAQERIIKLEYELQQTRENLQAVIEQLETTNSEQQATNKELIALNEKLEKRVAERTAELVQADESSEAANRAKSAFITHISHELRTPLNAILGFTQILQQSFNPTGKEQSEELEIIYQSGQHLLTLLNDIIYLAKIEAGKLELEFSDFNFIAFIDNLIAMMRLRAQQKGIDFKYQAFSPLPQIVHCDETCLRQVILNLLNNAIKFTNAGSVSFQVGYTQAFDQYQQVTNNLTNQRSNSKIRFKIIDTGIGIPSDKLTDIFLPFQQLKHNDSPQEGTGLGLTISQSIVQQMGGKIEISSIPGKGSVFWFDLDLRENYNRKLQQTNQEGQIIAYQGTRQSAPSDFFATPYFISPPVVPPSIEKLTQLDQLATQGDIRGILEQLSHLEQLGAEFVPFVRELRKLTENLQVNQLQNFIRQFLV